MSFYNPPAGGLGTVTSVNVSGGTTGLTTSGGPVTTSGTITLAGTLAVANGGTGVTSSTGTGSVVLSNAPTIASPLKIDGAPATSRDLRFTTSGSQRWTISADGVAESGTRVGTQLLIAGYDNSGVFTNVLGRGERGSGPLDNGAPVWGQFAPLTSTINAATNNRGVVGDNIYRQDTQPTTTLGTNPITTTNGSSLVSVAWTGALTVLVDDTAWVNFSGAAAVGGVTLSGWLPVTSVTTNDFVVDFGSAATSSATGGGAAVAIIPSFTTYNSKKSFNVTTGADGFPINDGRLMYATPSFFTTVASGQTGTRYENRWSVMVGPNDTTALNTWTVTGEEIDIVNRGETNKGYFPSRFVTPRLVEGVQIVTFDSLLGAPGGGSFTHCDFGHSINAIGMPTRWYHGYTVSPNTLVGVLQDTTSNHGGVGHEISGAYTYLTTNPFASIVSTSTIRVTTGSGGVASLNDRSNGDSVYIPGAYTLNGVSFGNASYTISNINLTTYTFDITASGTASASGSGGGSQKVIYFANDVPYAPINLSGEWAHGIVTDTFSKFDDGLLISTQAGNGVGWSTSAGAASINATTAGNITLDAPLGLSATGIGTNALTGYKLRVGGTATGATTVYGVGINPTILSGVTGAYYGAISGAGVAAAHPGLSSLRHFEANQATFNGSTVTAQYGFLAGASLIDATSNYGFYANIASGVGRWNFYAAGTAANYFTGATTLAAALTYGGVTLSNSVQGTGSMVLSTNAVLTTPNIGAATGTSLSTTSTARILNVTAPPAGGSTGAGYKIGSGTNFGVFYGSGLPTLSADQGSLYLRSDGTPYYNTNGTTGWSAVGGGGGSSTITISNKTAAYTVVAGDLATVINCTSGTFTVTLTAAATLGAGFNCWIWNTSTTSTNIITIDANASETIDGKTTLLLGRGEGTQIICDGTNWQTGDKKTMRGYAENILSTASRPVASGSNAVALGVSLASGDTSFAASNGLITGGATALNSNSVGYNNLASGAYASVFGGISNTAGASCTVVGGEDTSAATNSTSVGSFLTVMAGTYSIAVGGGLARDFGIRNRLVFGNRVGGPGLGGGNQTSIFALSAPTTNATPRILSVDRSATAVANNQITIQDSSAYMFKGNIIAAVATGGDAKSWTIEGMFKQGASAATTAFVGTPTVTSLFADAGAATWTIALSINTTLGCLTVTATGAAATTIEWCGFIHTTEIKNY